MSRGRTIENGWHVSAARLSHMTDFLEALLSAQRTGALVLMASFDDAQEQPATRLKVLRVLDCAKKSDIQHENGELRTYRTQYALWIEDEHGRVPNPQAQQKLEEYQAKRRAWTLRQEQLRNLSSDLDSSTELTELPGTHNGQDKTFFGYRDKFTQRLTVFMAKPSHAKRISTLIGEGGSIWNAVDILLAGEFLWPIWVRQHEAASPEAEAHDYQQAFDWANKTPGENVQTFFTRGWKRHQIFVPNPEHIDSKATERLRRNGLVVAAPKAPIDALIQYLPANDLKAPLKARGIKPGNKEAMQTFYRQSMDSELESLLRSSPWLAGRECFVPPSGFTWDSWHLFRTAYADMFDAATNWTSGNFEPDKYAALV